ncbi:MAG: hypothetical protein FWD68_04970 [Alphaproteobacteria bacterium]|nr:hypothetical protein [Alphaproteobacteria bacterium]
MRRPLLSLVFAVGLLSLSCSPFASAETPPGLDRFLAAARGFDELQKAAQAKNTMPRLSDPEVGDLIRTLSDADALFGTAPYNREDLPVMRDACARASQILVAYNLSGLAGALDKSDSKDATSGRLTSLQAQNAATFLDEQIPLQAFALRCLARMLPIMRDTVLSQPADDWTDSRRLGLEKMRHRVVGMLQGGLTLLGAGHGPVKPEAEAVMASALADTAAVFAEVLSVAQRKPILEQAEKIALPDLKPALERVIAALSRTDCEGLCQR